MKKGDYVGINEPFTPNSDTCKFYSFGIVVDCVSTPSTTEVLIYLYDPDDDSIYIDEFKQRPVFSFQLTELIQSLSSI